MSSAAKTLFLLCTLGAALGAEAATQCELRSPQHRLGLLELYTSEGCNSCPPADRWLSRLRDTRSENQVVPLAFHVDYWNQLGWPDRYSHNNYTQRQQQASTRNRAEFVYTPQFLLDGKDVRVARGTDALATHLAPINREPARAHITARVSLNAAREVEIEGQSTIGAPSKDVQTFIALYENGISSKVTAGENGGKTLQHDFVVRSLVGPITASAQGIVTLTQKIALPADVNLSAVGVAVFSQDRITGNVLQAVSKESCFKQ